VIKREASASAAGDRYSVVPLKTADGAGREGRPLPAVGLGGVVPYVTSWSDEKKLPTEIIMRTSMGIGFGIKFADETVADRDRDGILWTRKPDRHGQGRPEFGNVHSRRQRRAMRLLLCQVCAQPADRTEDGVLWLLPDYYGEAQGWPENYDLAEPPICRSCVPIATRLCPALRRGHLGIRARQAPVCGVRGLVYSPVVRRRSWWGTTRSVTTTRPFAGPWLINCCGHSGTASRLISTTWTRPAVGHDWHWRP